LEYSQSCMYLSLVSLCPRSSYNSKSILIVLLTMLISLNFRSYLPLLVIRLVRTIISTSPSSFFAPKVSRILDLLSVFGLFASMPTMQ